MPVQPKHEPKPESKHEPQPPRAQRLGWVLAGGQSTRMGGENKALVLYRGKALISHIIDNLAPQVGSIAISSGQHSYHHLDTMKLSYPMIADSGKHGPLEGILEGFKQLDKCGAEWLVTVPCDTPELPPNWVDALMSARSGALCAYVNCPESMDGRERPHYAHAVWHKRCATTINDLFNKGGRSLRSALNQCDAKAVCIDRTTVCIERTTMYTDHATIDPTNNHPLANRQALYFRNINTLADLESLSVARLESLSLAHSENMKADKT